jgi:hypothetical protein
MKFRTYIPCLALATLNTMGSAATPPNIAPGEYVYEGGNGVLRINSDKSFVIDTVGANAHICGLEGELHGSQGVIPNSSCVLHFKPDGNNMRLEDNQADECRNFCGARAGYTGLYIRPTSACTARAIALSRKAFKSKYDQRNYDSAVDILSRVLIDCKKVINHFDADWMRNDLALAQLRSGDKAACLSTLSPLVELAAMSDEDIRGMAEPAYVDWYISIAKATRTNLKLCKATR